jgi:hypothetical protein
MKLLRLRSKCFSYRYAIVLPAIVMVALHQLASEWKSLSSLKHAFTRFQTDMHNIPVHQNDTRIYEEITFTNYGWFQQDEAKGLKVGRSWHASEYVDAILKNNRFNKTAWEHLDQNPDPSRAILAFLDIDACNDLHYPRFGQDFRMASDEQGGRRPMSHWNAAFAEVCPTIDKALQSPAMSAPESRLVVLSCEGFGPQFAERCTGANRDEQVYSKLVVGHLSAHKSQVHRHDFGIPPMPVKAVVLNETQLHDIQSCNQSRSHLFSFTGRGRKTFPQYRLYWEKLHGKDGVHAVFTVDHYKNNPKNMTNGWGGKVLEALPPQNQTQDLYYKLLMDSVFAGAPRGDNLYSVRFSEILSAATIPVVYADGWVMPYTQDVVDWSELAVLLPEQNVSQTMSILQSMSAQEVCKRQQRILEFYQNYAADSHGRVRAILKIMDARLNRASHEISNFTAAPDSEQR